MNTTQDLIGKILPGNQDRDAIHIAVYACQAKHILRAGNPVDKNGTDIESPVGIVDPFLTLPVQKGQWFWIFLYPNTIINLRHNWAHPAFATETSINEAKALSIAWLAQKSSEWGMPIDYMRRTAQQGYICFGNEDYPDENEYAEELRKHLNIVYPDLRTPELYFRCAC